MATIKILGIDPSLTATGFCILTKESPKKIATIEKTGCIFPKDLRGVERLAWLTEEVATLLVKYKPSLVVMEGYAMGIGAGGGRTFSIGELGGVLKLLFFIHKYRTIEVPPTQTKKFATGVGNCQKNLILKEVYRKWEFDTTNDNIADAFTLAKIGEAVLEKESSDFIGLKYEEEVIKQLLGEKKKKGKKKKDE